VYTSMKYAYTKQGLKALISSLLRGWEMGHPRVRRE